MVDYQKKAEIAKERCEFTISNCFTKLCDLALNLSPINEQLQPLFNLEMLSNKEELSNNKELAIYSLWLLGQIMQDAKDIPNSAIVAEDSQRLKDSCYLGIGKALDYFKERSK